MTGDDFVITLATSSARIAIKNYHVRLDFDEALNIAIVAIMSCEKNVTDFNGCNSRSDRLIWLGIRAIRDSYRALKYSRNYYARKRNKTAMDRPRNTDARQPRHKPDELSTGDRLDLFDALAKLSPHQLLLLKHHVLNGESYNEMVGTGKTASYYHAFDEYHKIIGQLKKSLSIS